MRKQYTAAFKAQLVREVLKEEKPLNQIASEHGVHRNLLTQWRDQALVALPGIFAHQAERDQAAKDAAHAQQLEALYAEIGKLSTQLAWLKKTSPVACDIPPGEKRSCLPLAARGARSYNWLLYSKNKTYQLTGVRSTPV